MGSKEAKITKRLCGHFCGAHYQMADRRILAARSSKRSGFRLYKKSESFPLSRSLYINIWCISSPGDYS